MFVTARGGVSAAGNDLASVPLAVLAGQSFLLTSVLSGFRHAARIPAELRASSTFSLAWAEGAALYISGVKRAGWVAVVSPTLVGLTIWHTAILGPRLAALHLGVGLALSALGMETLFLRERRVPLVTGYVPSLDVKSSGVLFLVAVVSVTFALAWAERMALQTATGYVALLTILLGLTASVRVLDRVSSGPAVALDLDEQPSFPTQRLNLAE
jgi:hypothetical protein